MQAKVNSETATAAARSSSRFYKLFYGPSELRVGWRLLIFVMIVVVLMFAKAALIRKLPHSSDQAINYLVDKILKFALILSASWTMAKIEARTITDYGLPWRQMFGRQFWTGASMAFLGLTAFLTLSHLIGFFRFGEIAQRGNEIWKWGALYGLGFIVVALEEEFHYRGYQLSTLTKGIGFWPAAIALSAVFGFSHLGNSGENWLGIFNASAGGLLFCLLLRRSGDLWMPIGFHASWDWTQTYFYGVPDSGHTLPGHLFGGSFFGPRWLTGGTVGPEGSILLTLLLVLFWLCISAWLPKIHYPPGA
jgi:membrane protease YdiL (CAAX protease family)